MSGWAWVVVIVGTIAVVAVVAWFVGVRKFPEKYPGGRGPLGVGDGDLVVNGPADAGAESQRVDDRDPLRPGDRARGAPAYAAGATVRRADDGPGADEEERPHDPRVSSVPLDTDDAGSVVIEQQNAGPGRQVGAGEFKPDDEVSVHKDPAEAAREQADLEREAPVDD